MSTFLILFLAVYVVGVVVCLWLGLSSRIYSTQDLFIAFTAPLFVAFVVTWGAFCFWFIYTCALALQKYMGT